MRIHIRSCVVCPLLPKASACILCVVSLDENEAVFNVDFAIRATLNLDRNNTPDTKPPKHRAPRYPAPTVD